MREARTTLLHKKDVGQPDAPRIYYVQPLALCAPDAWNAALEHAAALGFTGVLMAPPFASDRDDVFRVRDFEHLHSLLPSADSTEGLARMADAATRRGLELLVDLPLSELAAANVLAEAHPQWFVPAHGGDDLPDPRRPPLAAAALRLRWQDMAVADAAGEYFLSLLERWAQAGIRGFRCLAPERVPAGLWQQLTRRLPQCRFLAWTPGLSPRQLALLHDCGFSYSFSSSFAWDFQAAWLAEEISRLQQVAPPLSAVEPPFGERLAARHADAATAEQRARCALRGAVATGSGLLVPMGFEFGERLPLACGTKDLRSLGDMRASAACDLRRDVQEANLWLATVRPAVQLQQLTGAGAACTALLRRNPDILILANADTSRAVDVPLSTILTRCRDTLPGNAVAQPPLAPGELRLLPLHRPEPIYEQPPAPDAGKPRVAIESVSPAVDQGRFAVKRRLGESLQVTADIFADGHEQLAACIRWRCADEPQWHEAPLRHAGNDRWHGEFPLLRPGRHCFSIEAWIDDWASLVHTLHKKHEAGQKLDLELSEILKLLQAVPALAERFRASEAATQLEIAFSATAAEAMARAAIRTASARSGEFDVIVERSAATFGSWYELFPRSMSGDGMRHGTFDDVIAQLPRIAAMGFDVVYFPPIHPIGRSHRKGRNNSLQAGADDPGSPYAIGSAEGGHEAIHPQLGSFRDFHRLIEAVRAHGMELALDFAIQCSPDHPWLKQHPEWFAWRADGSLRYAENPPKKYEDIVNVDFYAKGAVPALWLALRDIVRLWIGHGVQLFRVDNPHTKPLPFWEWLIADIRARHPEVIFLSEAFTRPKPMKRLAKLGFSQSYTYFTWRHTKRELTDYLTELSRGEEREYFRPHFFVNTPDINPYFLQSCGRAGFLIRAALATTLSGLWGMYCGFELCEARALPVKEEYADSEKYQLRAWDWNRPANIANEIARLNHLRRTNPALQSHLGVNFYNAWNDQILYFGKATPNRDNVVLVAISLDPNHAQEADFEIPLWEWQLPDDAALSAEDLLNGNRFTWRGKRQHLRLTPDQPYALWRAQPAGMA